MRPHHRQAAFVDAFLQELLTTTADIRRADRDGLVRPKNEPASRDWCWGMSYTQHPNH